MKPNQTIKEKIKQRRAQMLVHSCIYYEMNDNIVSDHQWQAWADELEQLQKDHPEECQIGYFDYEFRDWDGSTGNHLPHRHPLVYNKAKWLLDYHRRKDKIND
jgi:NAD-dependent DNA ligase